MGPPQPLRFGVLCLWIAGASLAPRSAGGMTVDGEISYTSDYIFRGISGTGGRGAGQIDLRVSTRDGTFLGVFASTLRRIWRRGWGNNRGWNYELEEYLGHRFDLSQSWSATLMAVNYSYLRRECSPLQRLPGAVGRVLLS